MYGAMLAAKFGTGGGQLEDAPLFDLGDGGQISEYKLQGKLADAWVLRRRERSEPAA
jgi:hypothetical protein